VDRLRRENAESGADRPVWLTALNSRDARFDGLFLVGAATTRVYCRPTCPAPFASATSLVWFARASAAEAAGFRPCRRRHPETSPGTLAWAGASAITKMAIRGR
jgi:AraC family transcriptional regulator of adaptative response / DNA-3-methyladenine glycosylase II